MKILVVEDEANIRNLIASFLIEHGHEVIEAKDGREAISKLLNSPVKLILADLNMPVMDGLEMLRKIKRNQEFRATPVIMITAEGDKNKVLEAIGLGIEGWILKPFNGEVLLNTIQKIIVN